jgi:hypothetical protein
MASGGASLAQSSDDVADLDDLLFHAEMIV